MTQAAFLEELDRHLTGLSDEERRRAADFYRELILDGMEDGKTEEEAVEALGSPEAAAAALLQEQPAQNKLQVLDEKKRQLSCGGVTEIHVDVRDQPVVLEPSLDDWLHIYYREDSGDNYHTSTEDGKVCFLHRHVLGPMSLIRGFYHLFRVRRILIQLPAAYAGLLDIRSTNGSLHAAGFPSLGAASFHTSNGGLTLSRIGCSSLEACTTNASVLLSAVGARSVVITSSNGGVTLETIRADGPLELRTSNAQVNLRSVACTRASVETRNGAIQLHEVAAAEAISAATSNAKIQLDRLASPRIRLKSSNAALKGTVIGNPRAYSIISRTSNARSSLPGNWEDTSLPNHLEAVTSNAPIDIDFCE